MSFRRALPWGMAALVAILGGSLAAVRGHDDVSCGPGFVSTSTRCCPPAPRAAGTAACDAPGECPAPLVREAGGCEAPDDRVSVPEMSVLVGPSDWEAQGRVASRTLHTGAFRLDAFEATEGKVHRADRDRARAASGVTRDEASTYCVSRGGRLPTADEWFAAAAGTGGHRYPWGETGAVCRRAAWGLAAGPCASGGSGPDTVGAHPDGDTPSKIHDMAGNVAEWVAAAAVPSSATGLVCGGSWASALATDLRTWSCVEVDPSARDARIGVRCAYDSAR